MQKRYMEEAIMQAKKAKNNQEVPIGAIIVSKGKIIARDYNRVEKNKNAFAHAEINVLIKSMKIKGDWRLNDCELYVTLEPCSMCKEAIKRARIKNVFYGIKNIDAKIKESDSLEIQDQTQKEEIKQILKSFFKEKR